MQLKDNGATKLDALVTSAQLKIIIGKCEQLKITVNPVSQIAQAKKMAPEVKLVLERALSDISKLLALVNKTEIENSILKAATTGQVIITGREGFKWQVKL